jgi:hypothetical protein
MRSPEAQISSLDRATNALHAASASAQRHIHRLCNPQQATYLPQGEPLIQQLDQQEARTWRAFAARVRQIAAED